MSLTEIHPLPALGGERELLSVSAETLRTAVAEHLATPRPGNRARAGFVAVVRIDELERLRSRFAERDVDELCAHIARLILARLRPDAVGAWEHNQFTVFCPSMSAEQGSTQLENSARMVAVHGYQLHSDRVHVSCHTGVAPLAGLHTCEDVFAWAHGGLDAATSHRDLVPRIARPQRRRRLVGSTSVVPRRMTSGGALAVLGYALALLVPLAVYLVTWRAGLDLTPFMYTVCIAAGLLTAWTVWKECLSALAITDPPQIDSYTSPSASAVIAAYMPNEAATIEDTVSAFLDLEHAGGLQVLLAYNGPERLPVEDRLEALAERDPRLTLLRVEGSTSKAQNVNAALPHVTGEIVGIFDADHHPAPGSFDRAGRWIAAGYDVVQGHCVVRNGGSSTVSKIVATEFETIYAVSHPGRARWHGFGVFGGSNGYWRTQALRVTRFRQDMLTEDIDSSIRALSYGARIAMDPYLVSTELAPTTWKALWHQRLRWAQGWLQVATRRTRYALDSRYLPWRHKLGMTLLLVWPQVMPWLALQTLPLIAFAYIARHGDNVNWVMPVFVLTTLFTLSASIVQMLAAWITAHPLVRKHSAWFWLGGIAFTLFYTELKNLISRTAQLKEMFGQRTWVVTPRSADAAPAAAPGGAHP